MLRACPYVVLYIYSHSHTEYLNVHANVNFRDFELILIMYFIIQKFTGIPKLLCYVLITMRI